MEEHRRETLSSIGEFASVQTCSCCDNAIVHVNFYNTTLRLTKEHFRVYTSMLNEAMLKIDSDGDFKQELEGLFHFYDFLARPNNDEE